MELGIFAKTYKRDSLDDILDAVVADGFSSVQFNMSCVGLESMPVKVDDTIVMKIHKSLQSHNLTMCALSATFNMIHPNHAERQKSVQRFEVLASIARSIGTNLLTLCTGTRDPFSMWRYHPDNVTIKAWSDLIETLSQCITIADKYDLRLGIEPETNNVIDSPQKARRLLDKMRCPRLTIIMDPANIFRYPDLPQMDSILQEAFDLLEPFIALAHCKDISNEDPPIAGAAGTGILNYSLYLRRLREMDYQGPLILHSLSEEQIPASVDYIRSFLHEEQ